MTTGRAFNVVISSAGRRVALLRIFRETLRALGLDGQVLATDVSALSAAYHEADHHVLVPPCDDDAFVPAMLDLCRSRSVRLVVPTIDAELPVYAAHRQRFAEEGVCVAVSSPEVVAIGADKVTTHSWLVDNGFPTVGQATITEVLARPQRWPFPLLVKPRRGNSSRGVAVVEDETALMVATRAGDFVAQTIASGVEYTVDLLVDRHGHRHEPVPRLRLEVRAGEVSKGVTVRDLAIQNLVSDLGAKLPGAFGVLNVQLFADPDGRLSVIELNPRFGGGFPLAWAAGAHYPRWMIEEILGRAPAPLDPWTSGLVMLRYDDAVFTPSPHAGTRS